MRDAAGQLADSLHLLGLLQGQFGLAAFRQHLLDAQFQPFVDFAQLMLGGADVGDIAVDADHAHKAAVRIEARLRLRMHGAPLPIGAAVAHLHVERPRNFHGGIDEIPCTGPVLFMDAFAECEATHAIVRDAPEFPLRAIEIEAAPRRIAHPEHDWCIFCDEAKPRFAFTQGALGHLPFRDILSLHEDAADLTARIEDRLIHEIQKPGLAQALCAQKLDRNIMADESLARCIGAVEKLQKPLVHHLGQRLCDRLSDDVAVADQLDIGRIGEREDMIGAAQQCGKAGCLLEQAAQRSPLARQRHIGLLHRFGPPQDCRFHERRGLARQALHGAAEPVKLGDIHGMLKNVGEIAGIAENRRMCRTPVAVLVAAPVGQRNRVADQGNVVPLACPAHMIEGIEQLPVGFRRRIAGKRLENILADDGRPPGSSSRRDRRRLSPRSVTADRVRHRGWASAQKSLNSGKASDWFFFRRRAAAGDGRLLARPGMLAKRKQISPNGRKP